MAERSGARPCDPLIESDSVEGRKVFGAGDRPLGTVRRLVIDKASGLVAYAVVASGGFLGIGEALHVVPWRSLTYDVDRDGFSVGTGVTDLGPGDRRARERHPDWTTREDEACLHVGGAIPHHALLNGMWFI